MSISGKRSGGGVNRENISRKPQRPGTASSAGSGSFSLRMSKLDWKRLSLLRSSSSSLSSSYSSQKPSLSAVVSPSSPSISSSASSSPSSPYSTTPITPKETDGQCLQGRSPVKYRPQQHDAKQIRLTNNRPTPNLQAPPLSREDLGKVDAFYAPPPTAHSIQALRNSKVNSGLLLPPEPSKIPPRSRPKPIQTSINAQNMKSQEIPVALPLSPIRSIGDCEPESGVLYLTLEAVRDEESGEVMHQLVEVSR